MEELRIYVEAELSTTKPGFVRALKVYLVEVSEHGAEHGLARMVWILKDNGDYASSPDTRENMLKDIQDIIQKIYADVESFPDMKLSSLAKITHIGGVKIHPRKNPDNFKYRQTT